MVDLPKSFTSQDVEKKWYAFWKEKGLFKADPNSKKPPFTIMIPPPNVTGVLHMGHALVNTLQDILIRYKRMSGFDALWMPGTDHAGISTQTVVERHLMQTTGKRRDDYSREDFLQIVWQWKEKSESEILGQLQALGCSCDWSRKRFTMDSEYSHSVRYMFKKLYDKGLIYQGDYLVNWDPVTKTALADDEVEYEEKNSFLWHFSYPLVDGSNSIEFATTRPETMLGDTAVAVNPKDERYSKMVGKLVLQPITSRQIPIIADDTVDPSFGTGVVKITPAHDHNDYAMGERHKLPMINILTEDGKINAQGGEFQGLSVQEARKAVIQKMKALGYFVKEVPHVNRIGVSYRSKAVIEPFLSKQWFVKLTSFKERLKEIVKTGKVKIVPQHWEATYFHWIDNLHDWCISRQLWWGHRIPIWYNRHDKSKIICYDNEGVPEEVQKDPESWYQDPDVLDTWFSSSLWPCATLGWPEKTVELERYYPNATLITGHDILFFWVARMLTMSEAATGKIPFPETFLHGLIYGKSYWKNAPGGGITYITGDERKEYDLGKEAPKDVQSKWEKMSKSKGNIIDPLEIISEYGTDACRMALASSATSMPQIDLDRRRFEEFKNFANKIWNGARFVFMNLEGLDAKSFSTGINEAELALEDRWILGRLHTTTREVHQALQNYAFDRATNMAYEFFWNELCAYYLEISKPILFGKAGTPSTRQNKQKLLAILLLQAIRLLHPMCPFITEELFQQLKEHFGAMQENPASDPYTKEAIHALNAVSCMVASYPQPESAFLQKGAETQFDLLCNIVYAIRNIRGEMKVPVSMATDITITGQADDPDYLLAKSHGDLITSLVKVKALCFQETAPEQSASTATISRLHLYLFLPEELKAQERTRLAKEEEKLMKALEQLNLKLSNTNFIEKAPEDVVKKLFESKAQSEKQLSLIQEQLKQMSLSL